MVRELLARHCPEWGADEEAAEFFGATLRVPRAWLAEARAQWAQYSADDPGACFVGGGRGVPGGYRGGGASKVSFAHCLVRVPLTTWVVGCV